MTTTQPNPDVAPGEARGAPLDLERFAGFTPGDWTAQYANGEVTSEEGRICEVDEHDLYDDEGEERDDAASDARLCANAALIAAAPALLEECRRQREEIARLRGALAPIVALLESDGPTTAKVWPGLYPLHRAAKAALAASKGERARRADLDTLDAPGDAQGEDTCRRCRAPIAWSPMRVDGTNKCHREGRCSCRRWVQTEQGSEWILSEHGA